MSRGPGKGHDAMRQVIVDAACDVVGECGVEALTFRRVAGAAGVSHGRVQHYFPGRPELVHAAFDAVQERARNRAEAALAAAGTPSAIRVVTAVLRATIPQSPQEFAELRVVAAFEALALTEPTLHEALRAGHAELVRLLADQIAHAVDDGEARDGVASAWAAITVLATAEGLSGQVLHGHLTAAEARQMLDCALTQTLGVHLSDNAGGGDES